jgi:glycerate 2-kinase
MNTRRLAEHIFLSGIKGVLPGKIIGDLITLDGKCLKIGYHSFDLEKTGKIYIIGAGKASASMAHYVEGILGSRITGGHVVTKYGHSCRLRKIKVTEAGHPVPDINSFRATEDIVRLADQAVENDLVICLISGGGSALLADHPPGCLPEEISHLNDLLVKSGADIREINTVRKHLSDVKGGNLMKHIWPAVCCTVIISDVTGDPTDIIASGPTVPDDSTFADAVRILEFRQLSGMIAPGIMDYLRRGSQNNIPENPKSGDPVFSKSVTLIAGNNRLALMAARIEAESMDLESFIVTSELYGDPVGACEYILDTALKYQHNNAFQKPLCLLFGGETTLKVTGDGIGGRNQHLALEAAVRLKDKPGITLLAGGTDGNDGNTEMAGAVVDNQSVISPKAEKLDPHTFLQNFDSYNYFKTAGGLIYTGPTLTNVMDLIVVIVE